MRLLTKCLFFTTIGSVLVAIAVALLFRFGVLSNLAIPLALNFTAVVICAVIATISVVVLLIKVLRRNPEGLVTYFVTFLICFLFVGYGLVQFNKTNIYPSIHNITTDPIDPPGFSQATLVARGDAANSVELTPGVLEIQQAAFPDLKGVEFDLSTEEVFATVLEEVKSSGWDIIVQEPAIGVVEATDQTFWYGFKDDVAIRVRLNEATGKSVVDMRSVSRVGVSDLGVNANRISAFLADLTDRLSEASLQP